jgi:branched-chain amino acid transport system ATP-binding protein
MLHIENVDVYYGDIQALFSVSLHVEEGEVVAVIGANGAGKTTLLSTISGLMRPSTGSITYLDKKIDNLGTHEIVGMGLAQVPEGRRIFPGLTVWENLMVAGSMRHKKEAELKKSMDRVLTLFPVLDERMNQLGWSLSGGEQQMLAVGRGLMARPRLLLMDEPSLGLAPVIVERLFDKIKQINQEEGITILLVEQNAFMALELAGRGYVLEAGHTVLDDSSDVLRKNKMVEQAYLGG